MRLFLGLIGGFVLLIALLIGGLWQRSARRTISPPAHAAAQAVEAAPEEPSAAKEPARPAGRREPRRSRVAIAEVAVLRGEVIGGSLGESDDGEGEGDGDDGDLHVNVHRRHRGSMLRVEADDGTESYAARVTGHRFELRVPPRGYTLTARLDGQIGRLPGVVAAAGENGELVIRLEPAAAIAGVVRGLGQQGRDRGEEQVTGKAVRAGTTYEESAADVSEDGNFEFGDLIAGTRYDLIFDDGAGRRARVDGVLAPSTGVVVELPRLPTLHGAVGAPPGEACDGQTVSIQGDGRDVDFSLAANCRFDTDVPRGADLVVSVSGPGVHYQATVSVPADGDPDFLCLNPPCDPPVLATLEVNVAPHECDQDHEVQVMTQNTGRRRCQVAQGRCLMSDLAPGQEVRVGTFCARCSGTYEPVKLRPGHNAVTLTCHGQRSIEGIVRRLNNMQGPIPLTVRCGVGAGRMRRRITDSHIFELQCLGGVREIEYQLDGEKDVWRKVAVPGSGSPALVELTVP